MKNFDIFFDLGSSNIRACAFNKNNKDNQAFVEKNCISLFKAGQIDLTKTEKEIEGIIFDLEKKTGEYLENINLMLDAPDSVSISLSLSKKKDEKKIVKEDIQYLVQDAKQQILKFNSDKSIIHIIVKNYRADDKNYDHPPIDISCKTFSIDIIFERILFLTQIFTSIFE